MSSNYSKPYKFNLTKKELEALYSELKTMSAVANRLKLNIGTIKKHLVKYGILHKHASKPRVQIKYSIPVDEMKALYSKFGTLLDIAKHLNVDKSTVRDYFIHHKIPYTNPHEKIEIPKEELEQIYQECGNVNGVAKKLDIDFKTAKNLCKRTGVEVSPPIRYNCNHNFFDKLNEKSMYWAGFISADGSISGDDNAISIGLAICDAGHLNKFKSDINAKNPIHLLSNCEYPECRIVISSEQMQKSLLANFNIHPKKSLIYDFPDALLRHPLFHHFLRGLIDGDGSVLFYDDRNSPKISLVGGEPMIRKTFEFLQAKFDLTGCCHKAGKSKKPYKSKEAEQYSLDHPLYVFDFSAYHDVMKLIDYLYKDATVYLDRKYDSMKKILEMRPANFLLIDKNKLIEMYDRLDNCFEIAKILGVSPITIRNRLVEYGVFREKRNLELYTEQMISLYNEIGTVSGVAKKMGLTHYLVKDRLSKAGLL